METVDDVFGRLCLLADIAEVRGNAAMAERISGERRAIQNLLAEREDACTPRPPRPEWFGAPSDEDGNPTGKWDSWMVCVRSRKDPPGKGDWYLIDNPEMIPDCNFYCGYRIVGGGLPRGQQGYTDVFVVPVAREGFPAPVGWGVVGGAK